MNPLAEATSLRQPAPAALSSSGIFAMSRLASSQTTWQGLLCLANPAPCAHHGAVGQEGFSREGLQWTQQQFLNDNPGCGGCIAQEWSDMPPSPPLAARRRLRRAPSVSSESNPRDGRDDKNDDDDACARRGKAKCKRQ